MPRYPIRLSAGANCSKSRGQDGKGFLSDQNAMMRRNQEVAHRQPATQRPFGYAHRTEFLLGARPSMLGPADPADGLWSIVFRHEVGPRATIFDDQNKPW